MTRVYTVSVLDSDDDYIKRNNISPTFMFRMAVNAHRKKEISEDSDGDFVKEIHKLRDLRKQLQERVLDLDNENSLLYQYLKEGGYDPAAIKQVIETERKAQRTADAISDRGNTSRTT